ncbi:MAG: cyclic nucleotide-binding domain-containing protein [Bdellovibrionota bacterium]
MSGFNKFLWLDLFSRKSETEITVLSTLKSNQLFARLTPRELQYVSRFVHLRNYEPGETIFKQYEKGLGMYMIAKGAVDIRVRTNDNLQDEMLVTTLGAGSFLGELALIDTDNKRTASAYAQGPTILVGFFKPDLLEIMERKPETGVKVLFSLSRVLGKRLNETTELITKITRENTPKKAA